MSRGTNKQRNGQGNEQGNEQRKEEENEQRSGQGNGQGNEEENEQGNEEENEQGNGQGNEQEDNTADAAAKAKGRRGDMEHPAVDGGKGTGTGEQRGSAGRIMAAVNDRKRISAAAVDFATLGGERCYAMDGGIDGIRTILSRWRPPRKWNLILRREMAKHIYNLHPTAVAEQHLLKRNPADSKVEFRFILDNPQHFAANEFNAGMLVDYATKWGTYVPELPGEREKALALLRSCPVFVIVSLGRVVASAVAEHAPGKTALISGAHAEPQFANRDYRAACVESLCRYLEKKASPDIPSIYTIVDVKNYPALEDFGKAGFSKAEDLVLYRMG